MATRLARRRLVERYMANIETVRSVASEMTEELVADLLRRNEERPSGPDGYGDGAGGSDRNAIARPTEGAVMAKFDEDGQLRQIEPDPIGEAIESALGDLVEMARLAKNVHRRVQVVVHAGDKLKGRKSTIDQCLACQCDVTGVGDDRIRAGYCRACYKAWQRFVRRCDDEGMDASHVIFRVERRAQIETPEVAEMGSPSPCA